MFKFLRRKLKRIEEKIEEELEEELKKEREEEEKKEEEIEKRIEEEIKRTVETRREIARAIGVKKPRKRAVVSDEKIDEILWDLEMSLLEADVALTVAESIREHVKEELRSLPLDRSSLRESVRTALKNAIAHVLRASSGDFSEILESEKKPFVILFVGVNGSGKTTAIAKLAHYLKKHGKSVVIAAADTFRAGAIEQLEEHARRLDVKLIKHRQGADPAAVAYDAIEHAKAKRKDFVLIDTAGRMQTNVNLMDEMAKIKRVAKPDMVIFVGDALAGNDAVEQARKFNEVVGVDGIILTKVDADAKGGSALSIAYTIGKPLLFIGVGQGYDDQIPFEPDWMIERIFGED